MINRIYKTILQNIFILILQSTDTLYRVCVRLLYHSKIVGVIGFCFISIFVISLNLFMPVFQNINYPKNISGFYSIDVGQGDSLLFVTKNNQTILTDTGRPDSQIVDKLKKILGNQNKNIDVLILTHPDSDHVGSVDEIISSYNVSLILYSPVYVTKDDSIKSIEKIKDKTRKNGTVVLPVFAGENIKLSSGEIIHFLSPAFSGMVTPLMKKEKSEDNYFSIVSVIQSKNLIFQMADAPQKIEKVLSKNIFSVFGEDINRNNFDKIILKVGHHGSKTSSAKEFIEALSPTDAVLSYGKNNRYGHPNPEVLDILYSFPEIKIHRTISGTVYFNE